MWTAPAPARTTADASAASSRGVCGTEGCTARVVPPFRHALISTLPSGMNKRGREAASALSAELAGVPGLEPRLTGPEPVGLPITPYPTGTGHQTRCTRAV